MPCTSCMVSESQRCCQAPPGASSASRTTWESPRRFRWYEADRPAWPAPMTTESRISTAVERSARAGKSCRECDLDHGAEGLLALLRGGLLAGHDVVGDGADGQRAAAVLGGQGVQRAGLHL